MSLQNRINDDIKSSMKLKDNERLLVLRSIKSEILIEKTKDRNLEISDDLCLKIISKLAKQRRDSAKIYKNMNREDLYAVEINQLEYLKHYLPEMMSDDEIKREVNLIINSNNFSSLSDMGKCMVLVLKKISGNADGKKVAEIVKSELNDR
tara:strand:- start:1412 stop:1864 length:453 start_codon:yes stop_codon:yes gene_type:complete